MPPVPAGGTVAVTGAAGFIGSCVPHQRLINNLLCSQQPRLKHQAVAGLRWCVVELLKKGYRVRATVRDETDPARCQFLWNMVCVSMQARPRVPLLIVCVSTWCSQPAYTSGRLTLHSADLDNPGCFDDIFKGCNGVLHVSHVSDYANEDYVRDTCEHIVQSINKSGTVSRLIFTSSIAGIISEISLSELVKRPVLYEDRYPNEEDERRTHRNQGYSISKNFSDEYFAAAAENSGGRWDSITLCPADNVGPIQSKHQKNMGPWQHNIEMMLDPDSTPLGGYPQNGAYRPWMTVDVRDDAACHVALLESVKIKTGERYIAWSTDSETLFVCV